MIDSSFSHLVVGVTDMDRALEFYRGLLGMDVVFDQSISGEPFDAALGSATNQDGRVVGGVVGGVMLELLSLGPTAPVAATMRRPFVGNQSISLSVTDLDSTYRQVKDAGFEPDQEPFEISGVRMFFVKDPDGMPVEFIEFPRSVRSSYALHRGNSTPIGGTE